MKRSPWGEPISHRTTTFVEPPLSHPRPEEVDTEGGVVRRFDPRSATRGPVACPRCGYKAFLGLL
jgi:hypothetical protein